MARERGKRERTADLHQLELASVAAQAERRSERAWEKGCKQLQKQVGELQTAQANGVLANKRCVQEWEEIENTHRVALKLVCDEAQVRRLFCYCCCRLLFIL
jgi:hypothetical protein